MEKKRIVKDYDKMTEDVLAKVKMSYPRGFVAHLINYTDIHGNRVSALPFETEEFYYLIRMTIQEARQIIKDDEDYDEHGNLREDFSLLDLPEDDILSDTDMEIVEATKDDEEEVGEKLFDEDVFDDDEDIDDEEFGEDDFEDDDEFDIDQDKSTYRETDETDDFDENDIESYY